MDHELTQTLLQMVEVLVRIHLERVRLRSSNPEEQAVEKSVARPAEAPTAEKLKVKYSGAADGSVTIELEAERVVLPLPRDEDRQR